MKYGPQPQLTADHRDVSFAEGELSLDVELDVLKLHGLTHRHVRQVLRGHALLVDLHHQLEGANF